MLSQRMQRQLLINELLEKLTQLGVDWSDITGTDSADPYSAEPPTNDEIILVQKYIKEHQNEI